MRTFLTKCFLAEPRLLSAGFRYGFLAFIIGLIILDAVLAIYLSPHYRLGRFSGLIGSFMLLFNYLAFQFRWSRTVTIVLRVIALVWTFFGLAYFLFLMFAR